MRWMVARDDGGGAVVGRAAEGDELIKATRAGERNATEGSDVASVL